MKFLRTALLGAAGLVALSLSARAASLTTATSCVQAEDDNGAYAIGSTERKSGRRHVPERKSGRRHVQEVEEEKEEVVKAQGRFTGTSLRPGATRPGLFHVSRSVRGCERGP